MTQTRRVELIQGSSVMALMNGKYTISELKTLLQLLLCVIFLCQVTKAANSSETNINWNWKIYKDFIDNGVYTPHVFPGRGNGTPIVVSASLSLSTLQDIDEKNQLLKTAGWVMMLWKDESFQWNPEDYGGVEKIHVPNHHIWIPDLTFINSLNLKTFQYGSDNKAMINYSGYVNFGPGHNFVTSCAIDVTYFPFDVQTCRLYMTSWVYDDSQLKLTTDPWPKVVNHSGLDNHGEWIVEDTWVELQTVPYNVNPYDGNGETNYTVIQCNLRFSRMPLYYMVNVICPCFLITLLSVSVFCLPSGCGEKISLGITVLLSYVVFLLIVVDMMPPRSDKMPLLGVFLAIVMILTASSILSSILVVSMDDKASYSWPSPHLQAFTTFMARVLCVSNKLHKSSAKQNSKLTQVRPCEDMKIKSEVDVNTCQDSNMDGEYKTAEDPDHRHTVALQGEKGLGLESHDWKFVARVVDRFLLYLYLIILSLLCLVSLVLWLMPKAK